jgi:hypothetical protein
MWPRWNPHGGPPCFWPGPASLTRRRYLANGAGSRGSGSQLARDRSDPSGQTRHPLMRSSSYETHHASAVAVLKVKRQGVSFRNATLPVRHADRHMPGAGPLSLPPGPLAPRASAPARARRAAELMS